MTTTNAPTMYLGPGTYVDPTEVASVEWTPKDSIRVLMRYSGEWVPAPAYHPGQRPTPDLIATHVERLVADVSEARRQLQVTAAVALLREAVDDWPDKTMTANEAKQWLTGYADAELDHAARAAS